MATDSRQVDRCPARRRARLWDEGVTPKTPFTLVDAEEPWPGHDLHPVVGTDRCDDRRPPRLRAGRSRRLSRTTPPSGTDPWSSCTHRPPPEGSDAEAPSAAGDVGGPGACRGPGRGEECVWTSDRSCSEQALLRRSRMPSLTGGGRVMPRLSRFRAVDRVNACRRHGAVSVGVRRPRSGRRYIGSVTHGSGPAPGRTRRCRQHIQGERCVDCAFRRAHACRAGRPRTWC